MPFLCTLEQLYTFSLILNSFNLLLGWIILIHFWCYIILLYVNELNLSWKANTNKPLIPWVFLFYAIGHKFSYRCYKSHLLAMMFTHFYIMLSNGIIAICIHVLICVWLHVNGMFLENIGSCFLILICHYIYLYFICYLYLTWSIYFSMFPKFKLDIYFTWSL